MLYSWQWSRLVWAIMCLSLLPNEAHAQMLPFRSHSPNNPHPVTSPTIAHGFESVDAWFSYQPEVQAGLGKPSFSDLLPSDRNVIRFGSVEEEIIVIGERQKRDFARMKPEDELTGPRALDAAQPFIPWPGTTCTYKDLCYDLSQPPLRATLPRLAAFLLGTD